MSKPSIRKCSEDGLPIKVVEVRTLQSGERRRTYKCPKGHRQLSYEFFSGTMGEAPKTFHRQAVRQYVLQKVGEAL